MFHLEALLSGSQFFCELFVINCCLSKLNDDDDDDDDEVRMKRGHERMSVIRTLFTGGSGESARTSTRKLEVRVDAQATVATRIIRTFV